MMGFFYVTLGGREAALEGRQPQCIGRSSFEARGACHRAGHFGPVGSRASG